MPGRTSSYDRVDTFQPRSRNSSLRRRRHRRLAQLGAERPERAARRIGAAGGDPPLSSSEDAGQRYAMAHFLRVLACACVCLHGSRHTCATWHIRTRARGLRDTHLTTIEIARGCAAIATRHHLRPSSLEIDRTSRFSLIALLALSMASLPPLPSDMPPVRSESNGARDKVARLSTAYTPVRVCVASAASHLFARQRRCALCR